MKNRRFIPLFVSASLFAALGFGALSPVSAQPAPATAKKARTAKRGPKGLPKRMTEKLEEKMGKPLTDDQRTRLVAAYKTRAAALKDAQDKFAQEASTITGLTADDIKSLNKRGKADEGKMAPAPR